MAKVVCNKQSPPWGGLFVVEHIKLIYSKPVSVVWVDGSADTFVELAGVATPYASDVDLCKILAKYGNEQELYGADEAMRADTDLWLGFSASKLAAHQLFTPSALYLDALLKQGISLSSTTKFDIGCYTIYAALSTNKVWPSLAARKPAPEHLLKWYCAMENTPIVRQAIEALPDDVRLLLPATGSRRNETKSGGGGAATASVRAKEGRAQEGKFVDLPGAEMGKVVVRFPPEASGYLHIGHAKAALLNQYYQQAFDGKLIMRFDDTNPAKENVHFEKVILEDVAMLEIKPDLFTHTSQYFDEMLGYCEQMIRNGDAYVDDTDAETMKTEREQRKESKNRTNTSEKNMIMWNEMKAGSDFGQKCCVRAKIDMGSANGCMRDPTIYRCKNEPHPRTGTQYKVYPTYDFACPIVDAIEGVTHTLRTMEYHDRDPQFYWFIDKLGLRKPYIWEYSRLSMTNTVLSKRKLTWFVQENYVDDWDDARMPTVRGVLRRGMTVQGLKEFIIAQGSSRSVVFMEWDKIWAFNKKVIDPIAPRFTAINYADHVIVNIDGVSTEKFSVPKHPKNTDVGNKDVWVGSKVLIDLADAVQLKENENATFINWGNIMIKKINKDKEGRIISIDAAANLYNKDYKKTLKLTWLADVQGKCNDFPLTYLVYFEHLISKPLLGRDEDFKQYIAEDTRMEVQMWGDPELKKLKHGDIIQLQRIGFFRVDQAFQPADEFSCRETPIVLFHIPDGHTADTPLSRKANDKKNQASTAQNPSAPNADALNASIIKQGDIVRLLKSQKAAKTEVDAAVKALLDTKGQYKAATGVDWKPDCHKPAAVSAPVVAAPTAVLSADSILQAITQQGNVVRDLKSAKSDKETVTKAVNQLLELKTQYKKLTGSEWKPGVTAPSSASPQKQSDATPPSQNDQSIDTILAKIAELGDNVRSLKASKADKATVDVAVKELLAAKASYKQITGKEWKPGAGAAAPVSAAAPVAQVIENKAGSGDDFAADTLSSKISDQGNLIRDLKTKKADKNSVDAAVKVLLSLKADFKKVTGQDWKPDTVTSKVIPSTAMADVHANSLLVRITQQGEAVRNLKSQKADKVTVDAAVQVLLALKAEFKSATGTEWKPGMTNASASPNTATSTESKSSTDSSKKKQKEKSALKPKPAPKEKAEDGKKQTRLGLEAKKNEALSDWYSQVITKGEMIEYYDVSGCYILRPWSHAIWEAIRVWFDSEIKKLGVENCYFPMFVSKAVLEKEKKHIADFAPEVAWVTRSGDSEMAEPIAVRPTSETVMYPAYAKWIQSYRDLPIKLNQWNNVVRWEFKHPQPFLRTREILWQEGHTAYAAAADAQEEVRTILELYARVYTDLLAIPVVRGRKTEKEKFAGGDYTLTVEAFVSASGRAVQGATSHHLGQNFSKMFEVVYECPETQQKKYVYQNSWGISTRTIGVMILVHADDQGLVLPPHVASVQAVIVPCGITVNLTDADKATLQKSCDELETALRTEGGVRVKGDYRDNYSPGWKFNHWELKGVPIRIEVGPKDVKNNQIVAVRRDTGEKITIPRASAVRDVSALIEDIHKCLYAKAQKDLDSHTILLKDWSTFSSNLDAKNIILAPFCGEIDCEEKIKADSARDDSVEVEPGAPAMGAKSLCIPLEQPDKITPADKCIHPDCKLAPKFYTLFGRSY